MQTMTDAMDEKSVENEEAKLVKEANSIEISTNNGDPCDLIKESDDVSEVQSDESPSSKGTIANTVHVQHAHSFQSNVVQTTPVLPRASSEQSKLRILTRTPAVQSMSSLPSEESFEDLPQVTMNELPGLRHQNSNKDESESGLSSLSSSRDSSFDYTDSTGTDLNEFIVKTLKNQRDKKMLLKLEKDFLAFISDPRKVFLQYPPMTSYHRMIVHRVAAYFGLDHNVDHSGKCIIVNKCPNTRFPEIRFSELVREDSEEDPLPKLILKRQNSSYDEPTPPEGNSPLSRRTLEDKKSKSIEEREEEYCKARARIFNHGSLSSQSSASSKDGDSCLSGLRDASLDDDTESLPNAQMQSVVDKTTGVFQPAVKVLTNNSKSQIVVDSSNSSKIDSSSSASPATLSTTGTDSGFEYSLSSAASDAVTVLAEGAPLLAGNIPNMPSSDGSRSKLVGTAGMIPLLSPNQTGGVVWSLPENQGAYSSGPASMFVGGTGSQAVGSDGYQAPNVAMQQGLATMPTYFFPGQSSQTSQGYQAQQQRQPTPPQQQSQSGFPNTGLPMNSPYGPQTGFPMYQTTRMYPQQQDLEILPQQQAGTLSQGNPHGMVVPGAGNPSSNFQDMSNQLAGMNLGQLEQQENSVFPKRPSGATYSPSCTQTFSTGQPVQYMVYRHSSGAMVAQPITSQGQATPGYLYPSAGSQAYAQQPYNPQIFNQQVYTQQPFSQPFPVGDQALLDHGSGSHTPPTPPANALQMGNNPGFMPHVPAMPGANPGQHLSTQVVNPTLAQVPPRLVGPYPIQGQQLVRMPGVQQMYACAPPYSVGQNRTTIPVHQPPNRYKTYSEKGHSKPVDIYNPDPVNQRRPSPSGSPRGNVSGSNRRISGGLAGKGGHGKYDGQRNQHQQMKGKQKHKRNQHRHSSDSNRKQPPPVSSVLDQEQSLGDSSCMLEVYDVTSNTRDLNQVVEDLRQAGAQIIWNEKSPQTPGNSTAMATFNSSLQAELALRTNANSNYKLRRCPTAEINVTEPHNY